MNEATKKIINELLDIVDSQQEMIQVLSLLYVAKTDEDKAKVIAASDDLLQKISGIRESIKTK